MSPFRQTLPWLLLCLSLSANAWLLTHPRFPVNSRPHPSTGFVTNLVTNRESSEERNVTKLVTNPPRATQLASAETAADAGNTADAPPPSAVIPPAAVYAAYADILAQSLETAGQHEDLARLLARWIAGDPASASEWLNRQPDDPRYDLPVSQVVVHLTARGSYALALDWADSIRTPEVRAAAIEEILAEQYRHHQLPPAALADAATRAGLPADRVQSILNYSRLD